MTRVVKTVSVLHDREWLSPLRDRAPLYIRSVDLIVQSRRRSKLLGEAYPTGNRDVINELSVFDEKPPTAFGEFNCLGNFSFGSCEGKDDRTDGHTVNYVEARNDVFKCF